MTLFPKRKTKDPDTNNSGIITESLQQRKHEGRIASRNKAFRAAFLRRKAAAAAEYAATQQLA